MILTIVIIIAKYSNMKHIINDIDNIIYKIYKTKHPILGKISLNWLKIIGTKYINKTTPLKVTTIKEAKKRINILFIEVNSINDSMEIAFFQGVIVERITFYMGYKAINKVRTIVKT